jgi:serine protease Do
MMKMKKLTGWVAVLAWFLLAGFPAIAGDANLELARQLNQAFIQVAENVSPSVVVITVTQKTNSVSPFSSGDDTSDEGDLSDWLRRWLRRKQQQQQPDTTEKAWGQGSGIIIRTNGYILTNRHVVDDAEKIEVRLKDGRTFAAEVRGVDAPSDVAVIKIVAKDLPVAKLADSSKTRVGEFAIAIGAPFSLDYTVTFGHVSAKDRSIPDYEGITAMSDQNFIQTDANINPGNSGGPLVNIEGEVIGINTLIRGLHTGIGFAIPINMAREIADRLIIDGKFTRSWLGIGIHSLREDADLQQFFPDLQDGVVVTEFGTNAPVYKSGLRPADVITAVDGKAVTTAQQLKDEIRGKKIGQSVTLTVYRKKSLIKITVKPGEWSEKEVASNTDDSSADKNSGGVLGFKVKAMTKDLAEQFDMDVADGVIVTQVDKSGLAARYGIVRGDIITEINLNPVHSLQQYRDAIKNVDVKKGVIVNLISRGTEAYPRGTVRYELLKEGME